MLLKFKSREVPDNDERFFVLDGIDGIFTISDKEGCGIIRHSWKGDGDPQWIPFPDPLCKEKIECFHASGNSLLVSGRSRKFTLSEFGIRKPEYVNYAVTIDDDAAVHYQQVGSYEPIILLSRHNDKMLHVLSERFQNKKYCAGVYDTASGRLLGGDLPLGIEGIDIAGSQRLFSSGVKHHDTSIFIEELEGNFSRARRIPNRFTALKIMSENIVLCCDQPIMDLFIINIITGASIEFKTDLPAGRPFSFDSVQVHKEPEHGVFTLIFVYKTTMFYARLNLAELLEDPRPINVSPPSHVPTSLPAMAEMQAKLKVVEKKGEELERKYNQLLLLVSRRDGQAQ